MNEHLRRAVESMERGAADARSLAAGPATRIRSRIQETVDEVLNHLESDTRADEHCPEDVISRLQRQSEGIAEDLRRADRLMRERGGADHRS